MRAASGALALVCSIALASCSDDGSEPAADDGEIGGTVTMWYLEDPRPEFLEAVKQGFEEKYPGTTLDMVEVPEDGYVTKVDTALLAKEPPDVGFVYEPRWMAAGSMLELDDTIEEYGIDTADMNQVALSECELDDHLYCLGSLTGSVVLIYNKDLFDKAGVDYPAADRPMSIDDYDAMSRALAEGLGDVYGSVAGAPFTWASRLTHYSEDATEIEGFVDDDPTLHMYDVLGGLAVDGVSPLPEESDLVPPSDMLGAGDVAMAITDYEYAANSLSAAGYAWGAAPPPVEVEGDAPFVFVGTDKYGVFADSDNPTTAEALVAYIATEGNRLRVEVADQPPLDQTMLDEWAGDDQGRQEVVEVLRTSTEPGLFVPGFWEVGATLLDLYSQLSNGEAEVDAISDEAPAMQEKLDREWETWNNIP
jgi:multiple sugar transport system substrate-binding protein